MIYLILIIQNNIGYSIMIKNKNYNPNKEIRIKTSMLRSDLCDYSDAYIVVKGTITVTEPDNTEK